MSTIKVSTIDTPAASDFAIKTGSAPRLTILQSGLVDIPGTVNATSFTGNGTIPIGGIIMWSGAVANIPTSWALCNGSNGTPDLRGRFVVGATSDTGAGYTAGSVGGTANSVVVSHTHAVTDPGHNHTIRGRDQTAGLGSDPNSELIGGNISDTSAVLSATTGISIVSAGVSGLNANLPPYYALAFIMRVA